MSAEESEYCRSTSHAIYLLQGKRKIEILCILRLGPVRLGQLSRLIPSASKKVLTENLRQLQVSGIIVRHDLSGTVRHIEYDLEETMRLPIHSLLDHLKQVGDLHGLGASKR